MLVAAHDNGVALLLRNRHRGDFLRERAVFLRTRRVGLAAQRKAVLVFAVDVVIGGDVLSGFGPYCAFISLLTKRQPMVVS